MNRKIYFAFGMILVGVFLLLKNFDLMYFSWRLLVYMLGVIWGLDLISRYYSYRQSSHLFWGLVIFFNSLWLIGANLFWSFVTVEELTSTIVGIITISLVILVLVEKNYLAILSAIPLIIYGFLILNNLYLWYADIYVDNYVNAGFGTALISLGIYYMTAKRRSPKDIGNEEPYSHPG